MIRRNKKFGKVVMSLALAGILSGGLAVNAEAKVNKVVNATYSTVNRIEDWGAATTKVVLALDQVIPVDSVDVDTFKVEVSRSDNRLANPFIESGERKVTNVYVSNKNGKGTVMGKYVTLELEIGPTVTLGSPLNYYNSGNEWIDCDYTITQVKDIETRAGVISGIVATESTGKVTEMVDDFEISQGFYGGYNMSYASYTPDKDNHKNPLIIWLHGGGEGGSDATIPLSANKAVNFASDEIQSYFDGAYVLTPQAPTRWMHGDNETGMADGTSLYTEGVMELIQEYVAGNDDIDTNRIYIGGCSNGGYMTNIMVRDYPDYFAACFPICGVIEDQYTTDEDMEAMKKTPMWMVTAETDDIFGAPIPAVYDRFMAADKDNLMYTRFDNVIDTSGLYTKEDGTPYEYSGHWSWIYVFNNEVYGEVNGQTVSIMEWLASQNLNER